MARIRDFLKDPRRRLTFRGVEVQIGEGRSADYTITQGSGRRAKNIAVEVKNWSSVRDQADLDDKAQRLTSQLGNYIRLALDVENDFSAIRLEWKGWGSLPANARTRFLRIINGHKQSARGKGITLEFIQI